MIKVAISTPFAFSSCFLFKNRKNNPKLSKAPRLTNLNCNAWLAMSFIPNLENKIMYKNTPTQVQIRPEIKPIIRSFLFFKLPCV